MAIELVPPKEGVFIYLGSVVSDIFDFHSPNSPFATAANQIQFFAISLQVLVVSYLTIWILYEAFQIILGLKQTSLTNFLWNFAMKTVVIVLFMNYGGFIDNFKLAINEIVEYAGNFAFSDNHWTSWEKVQKYYDGIIALSAKMIDAASWWNGEKILAGFNGIIAVGGGLIGSLALASSLSIVKITNSILIAIAPLMFAFLLLKSTKQIFTQYISLLISNFLALLFINIFSSTAIKFLMSLITHDYRDNMLLITSSCVVSGVILRTSTTLALQLAQQLVQVSLDSATKSAQTSTTIGSLATAGAIAKLSTTALSKATPSIVKNVARNSANKLASKAKNLVPKWRDKI